MNVEVVLMQWKTFYRCVDRVPVEIVDSSITTGCCHGTTQYTDNNNITPALFVTVTTHNSVYCNDSSQPSAS